jgi:GT2 family glycosyltransferase
VVHPSVMYRKSAVLAVGGYREGYIYVEDIDLWYRLVYSGYKISNVPKFLLKYRYHAGSTAHQARLNAVKAFKLRKATINNFKLKINFNQKLSIYLQFLVGIFFSGRQRQAVEGWYKKIFYHGK